MKTLVAYATKHGASEKCAKLLAEKLEGEVDVVNLKGSSINISQYEKVVVGGSVYAGMIRKEVKQFLAANLEVIKNKKFGMFVCGMSDGEQMDKVISMAYPQELRDKATAVSSFGTQMLMKDLGFFERFIVKKIAKTDTDVNKINTDAIAGFAEKMNNA